MSPSAISLQWPFVMLEFQEHAIPTDPATPGWKVHRPPPCAPVIFPTPYHFYSELHVTISVNVNLNLSANENVNVYENASEHVNVNAN